MSTYTTYNRQTETGRRHNGQLYIILYTQYVYDGFCSPCHRRRRRRRRRRIYERLLL